MKQDKSKWDLSFISEEMSTEVCPNCGCEVEIKNNGASNCPECGHEHVLPCQECSAGGNLDLCDWNPETQCTPFRNIRGG